MIVLHTRNPIAFLTVLFVMAASATVAGVIELFWRIDYERNAKPAVMVLSDMEKKPKISTGGYDIHAVDVRYISPDGELPVKNKLLREDVAKRLIAGDRISITYMKNNPQREYYKYDEPPKPWGWLGVGLALLATFFYGVKLHRRETSG